MRNYHHQNDSLVWQVAERFCLFFHRGDTLEMKGLLPEDFLLQWMHENFIGKKYLIQAMEDSAVRNSMDFRLTGRKTAIIKYSDDLTAVSINTSFQFADCTEAISIDQKNGYGLCIIYLKKMADNWQLKTVHLDIHCRLCIF